MFRMCLTRSIMFCILAGVITSALMCGFVARMEKRSDMDTDVGDGYYYGVYYGQIAHSFDKIVYETCDAPITATTDSVAPAPEIPFHQKCIPSWVDVLIVLIWRFLFRALFTFITTNPTITAVATSSLDKSTGAVIRFCLEIRRRAGLQPL
ncbi:hypothetical protein BSKO_05220 [Bryopsis sp. KO-2023]|nr:hypothetical protein BSKO_05220 [Bryopsis sp. KO-2023]